MRGSFELTDLMKVIWLAGLFQCVSFVAGGYVAALSAPKAPMSHATVLGIIGAIWFFAAMIVMWSYGEHWYPAALAVAVLASAVLGGRIHRGRYLGRAMARIRQRG